MKITEVVAALIWQNDEFCPEDVEIFGAISIDNKKTGVQ